MHARPYLGPPCMHLRGPPLPPHTQGACPLALHQPWDTTTQPSHPSPSPAVVGCLANHVEIVGAAHLEVLCGVWDGPVRGGAAGGGRSLCTWVEQVTGSRPALHVSSR